MPFDLSTAVPDTGDSASAPTGFDMSTARPETTPPETVYRQDTDKAVSAPAGLSPEHFQYLDDTQNNGKSPGNYLGFVNVEKALQDYVIKPIGGAVLNSVVKPFVGGVVGLETSIDAGTTRQIGEAEKEVFQNKSTSEMSYSEKIDAIARNNTPALFTMLNPFSSIRDKTLEGGFIDRLFTDKKTGLTQAEGMIQASKALEENNAAFVKSADLVPHDIIGEASSVAPTIAGGIGLSMLSGNPVIAAKIFSDLSKDQTYLEAKNKGWDNLSSDQVSAINGNIQGALQFTGLHYFLKAAEFSQPLTRFAVRLGTDAFNFMAQTGSEEVVKQTSGLNPTDVQGALARVGHAGVLGVIVGAGSHATMEAMKQRAVQEGIPEAVAEHMANNIEAAKPEIEANLTKIIQDQSSPMKENSEGQAQASKMMADFSAGKPIDASGLKPQERATLKSMGVNTDKPSPEETLRQSSETTAAKKQSVIDEAAQPDLTARDKTDAAVRKGRMAQLDDQISAIDREHDLLVSKHDDKTALEGPTKAIENKIDSLMTKRDALDSERADLLTAHTEYDQRAATEQAAGSAIKVKGEKLQNMNEAADSARLRGTQKGLREGMRLAKTDIGAAQDAIVGAIKNSDLAPEDRGKFISEVKNIQTSDQALKALPRINSRINALIDAGQRRETIAAIQKTMKQVKKSKVIAVDFAKKIESLFSEIDTKNRQPATLDALQGTLDYMKENPDANIPAGVLKKLEILNKRRLEDISTPELKSLHEDMKNLIGQGKTKLALMAAQRERLQAQRLEAVQKDSVPISSRTSKRAPIGERLSVLDNIKNKFAATMNKSSKIGLSTNPMDVFFDMLDGNKSYEGGNFTTFKKTVDEGFSRYLDLKDTSSRDVKNLTDELDLNAQNFDRIGAYAADQQEGGREKLLSTGYTDEELNNIHLSDGEMKMYNLMRSKLDAMLPGIKEVMRTVYNKDVEGVKDYFPFMTDFEATKDLQIQDQFGDNLPIIGTKKNVEKGFTIKRVGGAQKIRIDALDVFLKHTDNAAYLTEMGEDIKSLGDLAVSGEYGDAVGDIGQEMVTDWINLLARKGSAPGRIAALDAFRRNIGFAEIGFKLGSSFAHLPVLLRGGATIGADHVSDGILKVATSREWRQFLVDNIPEIRERVGDDPAYLDMGGNGIVKKARELGYYVLKHIDHFSASSIAAGAYSKSVTDRGGEVDLDNPDPIAVQDAQLAMRRTAGSSFAKDAPAVLTQGALTGNISIDKLAFQFQSFMLNNWSLIKHDMWNAGIRSGRTAQGLNAAVWITLAAAAQVSIKDLGKAAITAALGQQQKPDDKTLAEKTALEILHETPFVSQAVDALSYGSIPVPAIGFIEEIGKELKLAGQSKDSDKKEQHYTNAALLAGGALAGVPGTSQAVQIKEKAQSGQSSGGGDIKIY